MKATRLLILFLLLLGAAGCAAPAEEVAQPQTGDGAPTAPSIAESPTTQPTATTAATTAATASAAVATAEPAAPTAVPTSSEPVAAATVPPTLVTSGRLPEGAFFLGSPDAPITMIDYSDFL